MSQYAIIQGKGMSKSDKGLVEAILGGEMRDAFTPGDGIDQRGDEGPYSKKPWKIRESQYARNYEEINWRKK